MDQQTVERNTVLLTEAGSTVLGLSVGGDRDELGICIPPPEYVIGLRHFEQWVHRTQPDGVRSGDGDLDLTIYSLRKWCSLALKGNPTILLMLFTPDEACSVLEGPGEALRGYAPIFASRKAGNAFLGYMQQQRQRLMGERGQMRVKRPELVDAHGFDTKYAGHILRLGFQGVEYLQTGRISVPMLSMDRSYVLQVRQGELDLNTVLTRAGELEEEMKDLIDVSPLPDEPDFHEVNLFLAEAHELWWEGHP